VLEDSSKFQIEEYKQVKERINVLESKREQVIALNITVLAGILGFSNSISIELIPYIVLVLLLISSTSYSVYLILQNTCTAYLSERYDKNVEGLHFEKGYQEMVESELMGKKLIRYAKIFSSPFFWLILISISMSLIFGYKFWLTKKSDHTEYFLLIYYGFLIIGHLVSLVSIYMQSKLNIGYFCEKWHEIIYKKE